MIKINEENNEILNFFLDHGYYSEKIIINYSGNL